jgi:hypothetical protein
VARPSTVYLAGPMTGLPDFNFPAFHATARRWRAAGWRVLNPAENFGGDTTLLREQYLRLAVVQLTECDAIALLPDWQGSAGARLEYLIAWSLGLRAFDAKTMRPLANAPEVLVTLVYVKPPETILAEANRLTSADRNHDYGHPRDDFARTARMWTGILAARLREGAAVEPMDVPLCMIAVKVAREAHRHKRDNLVDIAGYARTAAMVAGDE